jgi:hypothetical protein
MPQDLPRALVANEYCRVVYDPRTHIARFTRTSAPIQSLEEAARHFGEAIAALDALGRLRIGLIIDSREAPMKNDPQYETAMAEHRRLVARGIPRIAVIVKTAVGRLHAQRLGKEDQLRQVVVGTDDEALEYLTRTD